MSTDLAIKDIPGVDALPAASIRAQVNLIQDVMQSVMIKDTHYGVVPGTGTKPTLLKPGAEKLCLTFRLDPQYDSSEHFLGEHLFVRSKCTLYHQTSGRRMGSGEGSCSTKESKYAWRQSARKCPVCGKEAIIKGKEEYGGGWLCFKKKDGCGAKWPTGAKEIEDQSTERVPNEDLADSYNTVLKMANKRSLIAAVLNVTAASDIFTQDIEDQPQTEPAQPAEAKKATLKPSEILARSERHEPLDSVESTMYQGKQIDPIDALPISVASGAVSAYSDMIVLAESVREASDLGNRIEKDEALDILTRTMLRESVKQKILSIRAKKS